MKATTATRVIAVDARTEALTLAEEVGADHTVLAGEDAAEQIRSLTRGLGADVTVDFVGADATLALAAASTRVLGDLTIVGIAGGALPVSFVSVPYEVSIQRGSRPSWRRYSTSARAGW